MSAYSFRPRRTFIAESAVLIARHERYCLDTARTCDLEARATGRPRSRVQQGHATSIAGPSLAELLGLTPLALIWIAVMICLRNASRVTYFLLTVAVIASETVFHSESETREFRGP
jgi:hypothetical protein